jgi:heat shock protein beta-11
MLGNMLDVAVESAGGIVSLATAHDERFPPENIIDGKTETFWMSTGLFPQEFIITFGSLMSVSLVRVQSTNVRKMVIEQSMKVELAEFDTLVEKEFDYNDGQLQREEFKVFVSLFCCKL